MTEPKTPATQRSIGDMARELSAQTGKPVKHHRNEVLATLKREVEKSGRELIEEARKARAQRAALNQSQPRT